MTLSIVESQKDIHLLKNPEVEKNLVKIGIVQTTCSVDKQININKAIDLITDAANKGAQIVCLQELFSTSYFCNKEDPKNFSLAEPIPGPTTDKFSELCKKLDIVLVASLFEKRSEGVYHNSAAVIDADGTYLGKYRKHHIPDDPGYHEKFYFAPGDEGYKVFKTKYGRIGVLICWDQWFPEAARLTAMRDAQILFYPTAIGWPEGQDDHLCKVEYDAWQVIQRGHAITNGLHVVAVNRIGNEDGNVFWGGSFIADPIGEVIFQARHDKEIVWVQEIDLNLTGLYRSIWPFFRDRRVDTYQSLTKRFDAEEER
jgi:N-carbamoylputrescine amidase